MTRCFYLDSSAILRLLMEPKGKRVSLSEADVVVSSELIEVEIARVLDRARLEGHLDDLWISRKSRELRILIRGMHLFPISSEVVVLARTPLPVRCRAGDSLHVATAQLVSKETGSLEFWTHDPVVGAAAAMRDLEVRGIEVDS